MRSPPPALDAPSRLCSPIRTNWSASPWPDEGPGIAPALHSRLFEPGASSRPGGTGLGLAISRLLARQLNGELKLALSGPAGAKFQASIPAQFERRFPTGPNG